MTFIKFYINEYLPGGQLEKIFRGIRENSVLQKGIKSSLAPIATSLSHAISTIMQVVHLPGAEEILLFLIQQRNRQVLSWIR